MERFEKDLTGDVIEVFNDIQNPIRKMQERLWFRNILYYMGEQYIEWVVSLSTFRRKQTHPFIPTPVANVIRDYIKSMKALYLNREYALRVWPNSNDQSDKDAAKLGEQLLDHFRMTDDEAFERVKMTALEIMLITGTSFIRTFPYKSGSSYGMDYNGKLIEMGDIGNQAILPFSVHPDLYGTELNQKRYTGIKSLKPIEWVEDTFKTTVKHGEDDPKSQNYERRLMRIVAATSPWRGQGLESQLLTMKEEELCVFKEVEFAPTAKYPEGRYVVLANDELIFEHDHLPIPVKKDGNKKLWYYTLTDFHYNRVIGRFWSDSGVNDLISPQNAINSIDQALEMNRKGLGRPIIWFPKGSKIKRVNKHGMSFLAIEYDTISAAAMKPEVDRGQPLPNQVLDERNIHKETIQESAGDPKHILRGKPPSSKASGIMVDILRETAEAGHTPDIGDFYRRMKQVHKKQLILGQEIYTEQRMIKIAGAGNNVFIRKFKGADLRSNFDVRVDLDSGAATSRGMQTQTILKLLEQGFFGQELMADPQARADILKRLGIGSFRNRLNVDVDRAEKENSRIADGSIVGIFLTETPLDENGEPAGEPRVVSEDPLFQFDDHFIHYEVHRRFALSPEFMSLPEEKRIVLLSHLKIHEIVMKQQQAAAMAEEAMLSGKVTPEGQNEQGSTESI